MLEAIDFLVGQLPTDLLARKKIIRDEIARLVGAALTGERERLRGFDATRKDCEALLNRARAHTGSGQPSFMVEQRLTRGQ